MLAEQLYTHVHETSGKSVVRRGQRRARDAHQHCQLAILSTRWHRGQ